MKTLALIASLLLITACTTNTKLVKRDEPVMHNENNKLCENHKRDFQYFRTAFDKEHAESCSNGCTYTSSMNKNSDTMERIAGLYYSMNCDSNYGRL